MRSVRVASSNDRELPPPELGPGLDWDQLTEILLREVSAEAAGLLAEPIQDRARSQTHWHIAAHSDPKPISSLSEAERTRLLNRLHDRRKEILRFAADVEAEGGNADRRLAAVLRSVIEVPDEKLHVWSADGKPVLTAWGRHPAERPASASRLFRRRPAPPIKENPENISNHGAGKALPMLQEASPLLNAEQPLPDDLPPPIITPATSVETSPPPDPRQTSRPRLPILLWPLFAILVAGGYYALLPACGLDLPIFGELSDRCEVANSPELESERQRSVALREAVDAEELKIAENQASCAEPAQRSNIENPALNAKETEERRIAAHASQGKLDVSLVWNGREDLDLHVICPGGHIAFNHRLACGGNLEVDRNAVRSQAEDNPIEHVTWQEDPPEGDYRIEVTLYDRFELPVREIPFTVVVRDETGVHEFTGAVQHIKEPTIVTSFQRKS
jgi:hypothetical protein